MSFLRSRVTPTLKSLNKSRSTANGSLIPGSPLFIDVNNITCGTPEVDSPRFLIMILLFISFLFIKCSFLFENVFVDSNDGLFCGIEYVPLGNIVVPSGKPF
ncbi:hypothetical protein RhiirA5_359179 [Rhizophagus irregularis]|uniref:Uncharacterized protein n=1 Tax=Rhizophagus irregularis TaxID=588596 RepID=A0A2N0PKX2_9GLOM|nr:hypothetical protein RhiirA5_359179 [Rhizophagus irregularis]PKC70607.1 hypothetical protein RhiirA1_414211 [Rhizophagus irregularis]